jgi:hypothetical protein
METYIFKKWETNISIPNYLYFLSLSDKHGSLTIFLKELGDDENTKCLKIEFKHTLMYRVTPESSRILPANEIPAYDGFWITKQSDLLNWFNKESAGIYDDADLIHYTICNLDNIIEVITTANGILSWTDVDL